MERAGRLFHTIVVLGAAAGCGPASDFPSITADDAAPPDTGTTTAPIGPGECAETAQFHCDGPRDCSCNLEAPTNICGCDRSGEFRCHDCVSGPPVLGRCPNGDGVDCFCNKSIAVAAESDCAFAAQFVCAVAPPVTTPSGFSPSDSGYTGWFAYAECWCDSTRPITATECSAATRFACAGTAPACPLTYPAYQSSDVASDCDCLPLVPPIQ